MKYTIYKFEFQTGVHFGTGRLNETTYVFHADQLFSALYIEALKQGTADAFYQLVKQGQLLFSDGMPYVDKTYLMPKPMVYVQTDKQGASTQKKAYKKLKYIPVEQLDTFLQGQLDISEDPMENYGYYEQKTMAEVRSGEDAQPYRVGTFYYGKNNGVYIIVGYEEETALMKMEELLESLSYVGIGGKKSSGLGKFELIKGKMTDALEQRLSQKGDSYILLSAALPREEELEDALNGATYLLEKRAGFVAPAIGENIPVADEWQKKRDMYVFSAGSCFTQTFAGDIYDVSKGGYPVYRYACAMFLGV